MENVSRKGDEGWKLGIGVGKSNLESEHSRGIGACDESIRVYADNGVRANIPDRTNITPDHRVGSPGVMEM
jgi:hypothetical protein